MGQFYSSYVEKVSCAHSTELTRWVSLLSLSVVYISADFLCWLFSADFLCWLSLLTSLLTFSAIFIVSVCVSESVCVRAYMCVCVSVWVCVSVCECVWVRGCVCSLYLLCLCADSAFADSLYLTYSFCWLSPLCIFVRLWERVCVRACVRCLLLSKWQFISLIHEVWSKVSLRYF